MRIFWKIFRAIASVLLLLAVVLPAAIYVILSLEPIQTTVRTTASEQLSDLLGADVRVRYVRIHPFNRVTVGGISLALGSDTVAQVETCDQACLHGRILERPRRADSRHHNLVQVNPGVIHADGVSRFRDTAVRDMCRSRKHHAVRAQCGGNHISDVKSHNGYL